MSPDPLAAMLAGLVLSTLVTGLSIPLAHAVRALDIPGGIKVHSWPTPRLGGLGLVAGMGIYGWLSGTLGLWGIAGLLTMTGVGIIDDCRGLNAKTKLSGQTAAGVMLGLHFYTLTGSVAQTSMAFIFVVGLSNAVNLLDGLDGLAAGSAFFSVIGLGFVMAFSGGSAVFAAVLAACLLGLLFWNYPKARTFMGDTGSMTIGYTLAFLITGAWELGPAAFIGAALTVLVPAANTLITIIRRLRYGRPLFEGDREHFFDKIHRDTGCPVTTIWIVYGLTALFAALGAVVAALPLMSALAAAGAVLLLCTGLAVHQGWLQHENNTAEAQANTRASDNTRPIAMRRKAG